MSGCGCLRHERSLAQCTCMCAEHDREFSGGIQVVRRALRSEIARIDEDVSRLFRSQPALSAMAPFTPNRHRSFASRAPEPDPGRYEITTVDRHVEIARLREALEFYASADTYTAVGFLPDFPAGDFVTDFSDVDGHVVPGARARAALAGEEFEVPDD